MVGQSSFRHRGRHPAKDETKATFEIEKRARGNKTFSTGHTAHSKGRSGKRAPTGSEKGLKVSNVHQDVAAGSPYCCWAAKGQRASCRRISFSKAAAKKNRQFQKIGSLIRLSHRARYHARCWAAFWITAFAAFLISSISFAVAVLT